LLVTVALPWVSGCDLSSLGAFGRTPKKTEAAPSPDPVVEPQAPDTSVISPSSTETQTLAGSGAASGTLVSFPPGSVALDTKVSIKAGGELGDDVLTELGVETTVVGAGPSIIVDSDGVNDPAGTLSITLPLPASASLLLTSGDSHPVVVYRVVVKATGEYRAGIMTESEFASVDAASRTVTISSSYFGQFQTIYIDTSIAQGIEKKSATIGFKGVSGKYEPSATKSPSQISDQTVTDTDSGAGSGTESDTGSGTESGTESSTASDTGSSTGSDTDSGLDSQPSAPGEFQLSSPTGTLPSRNVDLTWTPSSDATDMTVSLASTADCAGPIMTTTVAANLGQATFTGVANGTYFACAKASNGAGIRTVSNGSFSVGSIVIGKPDFTTTTCTVSAACTSNVVSAVYSNGRLIATDDKNHRVLIWHALPTSNGQPADLVLGQPDFTSSAANRGGAVNGGALNAPLGATSDGPRLVIADSGNHRLLIWSTFPTANGQAADLVVGETSLTAATGPSTDGLNLPYMPIIYDGKLVVPDSENNRVLIWNALPTTNGTAADIILGQPDQWSASPGTDAATMYTPIGVTVFQGDLWVSDTSNHRVIRFHPFPTTSFGSADLVLGQPDMSQSGIGSSASTFNYPHSPATDGTKLLIPDADNNRIVIWNAAPTTNGAAADAVLGQANLTTGSQQAVSESTFDYPTLVHIEDGTMVIADWGHKRVLLRPYP
jgi:hypothetical protein